MDVNIPRGKYVLAVSGGVDSMALLDLLAQMPGIEVIAAHFNHGIRPDAPRDEQLVKAAARAYNVPYEAGEGKLGSGASEATARKARYGFLYEVKRKHAAAAIITAHHQDDVIETALLNTLRGTGRRGLSAISSNIDVIRPFLHTPKAEITKYANQRSLKWREDKTNLDTDYLRNYLRIKVLPKLKTAERVSLIQNLDKVAKTNRTINYLIATMSRKVYSNSSVKRQAFAALPNDIANELVAFWLRTIDCVDFDRKTVERLAIAIKTARAGTTHHIKQQTKLLIGERSALFSDTLQKEKLGLV